MNHEHVKVTTDHWRVIADQDQAKKKAHEDQHPTSSHQTYYQEIKKAVDQHGWRGAVQNQENTQIPDRSWRQFRLSEEEVTQREDQRRQKMEEKSQRRAKKAEKAKKEWSKRANKKSAYSDERKPVVPTQVRSRKQYKQKNSEKPSIQDEPYSSPKPSAITPSKQSASVESTSPKHKKKKTRPPINAQWLKNSGLRYLGRFSASEKHFRTILARKIKEADSRVSEDPSIHQNWIDEAVQYAKTYGGLDDEKFALNLAKSLKRRGIAKKAARLKLKQKKLESHHVQAALQQAYEPEEQLVDPNLYAACVTAKKKRLGPWGPTSVDYPTFQKQLAKLARRGFSYGIAQQVLKASLEEAEEWIHLGR